MWTEDKQRSAITEALGHIDAAIKRGAAPGAWPNGCPLDCKRKGRISTKAAIVLAAIWFAAGLMVGFAVGRLVGG